MLGVGTPRSATGARRSVRIVRVLRRGLIHLPEDSEQHAALERIRGRAVPVCRGHALHVYIGSKLDPRSLTHYSLSF